MLFINHTFFVHDKQQYDDWKKYGEEYDKKKMAHKNAKKQYEDKGHKRYKDNKKEKKVCLVNCLNEAVN